MINYCMMAEITRRTFLKSSAVALAGLATASAAYIAVRDESQDLVVEPVTVPLANLHAGLEGFTIVQLSDFHLLPLTKPKLVRRAVDLTNDLKPDLIVLTGDYVWREVEAIYELAPILVGLNARMGVYAALGNHDLWTDVNVVRVGLDEVGLPLLVKDDGWSGNPELGAALDNAPHDAPVVLLYHEPDLADEVSKGGRVSLQLSGHSHGGQIRFPGVGAVVLPHLGWKYDMGLYRVGEMWLYTNRGIGVTNEPIRWNCAPEITLLTLARA
jgi:predicted MPP superfamily phosphohydrolase